MSHTSIINDTAFVHNGDYSGDVQIIRGEFEGVIVPFDALRGFIAQYVRECRIQSIEQSTDLEILNISQENHQ